jgi:tetratricopeptide (TPR) repeat protein
LEASGRHNSPSNTPTAIAQRYQAVFWTRADTADALIEGYGEIARLLQLPEKEEQDQSRVVKAVQEWLRTQSGWLLILDNADDLTLARTYLPSAFGGHILLTTRAQSMGRLAARIEVQTLDQDVGALLLLRRAGLVAVDASLDMAPPSDLAQAKALAEELGGLPLALDQAGAYIEETACGLSEYQRLYQTRAALLRNRRGVAEDHPEPVATTWSLSFAQVEQHHPAAADLLRLCAFLAPDAIPEKLLTEGAKELGEMLAPVAADPYLLDQAITALRAYSLLARDPQAHTLSVHRLVQAVVRDNLPMETQRQWMQRAVQAVEAAYPGSDFANWSVYERLLPHALVCATWIEQASLVTSEASRLLNQAGYYLNARGRYAEAEPLYVRALAIREQQLGAEHPGTATSLNNLAALYHAQGKDGEAEALFQRTFVIREQALGASHPDTAQSLWWLAVLSEQQQRSQEAKPLYERALSIYERTLGSEHPTTRSIQQGYTALLKAMKQDEAPE